jgi:hypothetical protein
MTEFKEFSKIPRLNRDICISEKIDGTNAQILIEPIVLEAQGGTRGGNNPVGDELALVPKPPSAYDVMMTDEAQIYAISAGSRNRWLGIGKADNFGFAGWVKDNAAALVALFGPGRVFGEWWGAGIQRRYGLTAKRFSPFNVSRYGEVTAYLDPRCVTGPFPHGPEREVDHKFHKGVKVCQCREARAAIKAEIGGVLVEPVPVLYRGPWHCPISLGRDEGQAESVWAPQWALNKLRAEGSQAVPFLNPEGIVVFHEASGTLYKATLEGDEKPKGQQ